MSYCEYVNIKQGSSSVHRFSNGNTLPLVQLPFGMAAFAPQTNDNTSWYYHPSSRSLEGVRLTHQPSPWIADYGAFVFMPQKMPIAVSPGKRWSGYKPEEAVLTPYYMKLRFLRSRCDFELAPSERGAIIRLNFDEDGDNYFSVLPVKGKYGYKFDKKSGILTAYTDFKSSGEAKNFRTYLVMQFPDDAVESVSTGWEEMGVEIITRINESEGDEASVHLKLKKKSLEIKLATSYISYEQAMLNLLRELGGESFESLKEEAYGRWEECLSRLTIESDDEKQLRTFYSCTYRAFLYPHRCHEYNRDGRAIHYSPHNGDVREGVRYTDNGFWDTYRTCYSFFSLAAEDELREMLKSYINEYVESGWLPRWLSIGECGCMPSTLIDAVICDAAVKGFIDKPTLRIALDGMLKHSLIKSPDKRFGRTGVRDYCKYGYVTTNYKESVNLTLDAAYGDWCIARVAELLGIEVVAFDYYKRSENYKNLFDPETGFMRAKDENGEFRPNFSPISWGRDYTEGSAWQNSFAVPHDIEGLAELYGGKERLEEKIDALFAEKPNYETDGYEIEIHEMTEMAAANFGQCAISNQPSFHIPYIYSALGNVEKTAYWVERICKEAFSYEDDGFPGDEDNGSMALWYVFGVLGFYPFCPGKAEFVKGKKQVKKAFLYGKEIDADSFEGNIIPYDAIKFD